MQTPVLALFSPQCLAPWSFLRGVTATVGTQLHTQTHCASDTFQPPQPKCTAVAVSLGVHCLALHLSIYTQTVLQLC